MKINFKRVVKKMKNCKCRFIVTSDIHYEVERETEHERFEKGMRMAYEYAESQPYKKIDAFIANGDFANSGDPEQMKRFKQSLDAVIKPDAEIIMTMASHEFFHAGPEEAYKNFREIFGLTPDTHKVINDLHFIGVSCSERCWYHEDKLNFFAEELKKAAEDDRRKPIFVFQHPHPQMTVYGSSAWGEDSFMPILMNYPQIIDFSGHSHAPINDPRSIHQEYFTSMGSGSLSYFELDEFTCATGTVPEDAHTCAQYLIVEVYEDNSVKILPFDVLSGKFFNDGYVIEECWNPDKFVYTDARADTEPVPQFAGGAKIDVAITTENIEVTFTQAIQEPSRTDTYTIAIKNNDGLIVARKNIFSSYYIYNMPESLTVNFDNNFDTGRYTVEITANGFWKVKSKSIRKEFEI